MSKSTDIKRYYKGRPMEESESTVKVVVVNDIAIIQGYDEFIEIAKDKIRILIYGSFIIDCYDVDFVDITDDKNNPKPIGIPLAVGIGGFNNARKYAKAGAKALGYKFFEDALLIGHSILDRDYIALRLLLNPLERDGKIKYEILK